MIYSWNRTARDSKTLAQSKQPSGHHRYRSLGGKEFQHDYWRD